MNQREALPLQNLPIDEKPPTRPVTNASLSAEARASTQSMVETLLNWFTIPSQETQEDLDRFFHGLTAHGNLGLSPAAMLEAYNDWLIHLAVSPGKQWRLASEALAMPLKLLVSMLDADSEDKVSDTTKKLPHRQDTRFAHSTWQHLPFSLWYRLFLINQDWWQQASTGVHGVSQHHENMVEFTIRQWLDIFSPSNTPLTNPQVLHKTAETFGANLVQGYLHWLEDTRHMLLREKPDGTEAFTVGKQVATTPGKVVFRNRLIELIQYSPTTATVHPEPILIVPAWIMKYYILDLSPHNSMIAYLVAQGFTVFTISWHNPTDKDSDLSLEDYRLLGVEAALEAIETIVGSIPVHGMGYCLGGTLLSIVAATQAREKQQRFKTLTLLAAQIDFSEAGEIELFIDQSQVTILEDMMWTQGKLKSWQMAGAFQLLRSKDLIWSRLVQEYLLGERTPMNDLMAWNADTTHMPYTMHSQYLKHLFLKNELSQGHYRVENKPISVTDIRAPIFAVATEKDHVAPWHSVYKIHLFSDTSVTFLLTNGGHNAGIVSEPGHPHRHYRVATRRADDSYLDPDEWVTDTPEQSGSWWPEFSNWLTQHSGKPVSPPTMGAESEGLPLLEDAPGHYVLESL